VSDSEESLLPCDEMLGGVYPELVEGPRMTLESSPCDLDLIAHFEESLGDLLAVLALDLDHIVLDSAATATKLLELLGEILSILV
jgi:hypothetical protein